MKLLTVVAIPLLLVAPAMAQEGIVASGMGTEMIVPTELEIELRLDASGDLADDALVKYRDAKRRLVTAFEGLKLKDLHIEEKGITIGQEASREQMQAIMRGMQPVAGGRHRIKVSSLLVVRLKNIVEMPPEKVLQTAGKLLETAQDAGAPAQPDEQAMRSGRDGSMTSVRFSAGDFSKAREAAYRKAVDDARGHAERLAKLSGVQLGSLLGASEGGLETATVQYRYSSMGVWSPSPTIEDDRIVSDSCTPFPLRVRVSARFAIQPAGETASR
jgi:uncharacterized protein YggE